ncbi:MAG: hypothetical protein R2834_24140 [Rhodothermales bacterium]
MQQAIIIRVIPEDFDSWRKEHDDARDARLAYGITDGPFYRDERDTHVALVHLNVENLDRAMEWFKSDAFREGVKRAGGVQREIWIGKKLEK